MLNKTLTVINNKISKNNNWIKQYKSSVLIFENYTIHNKRVYNILFFITLSFFFASILYLNIKTPLIGDDFVYSFIYQTEHRLTCINDVLHSQLLHYNQWGGRSIVHFITQSLLLINNSLIIDIINSFGFVAFILVLHYHITGTLKNRISILIISFSLTWFLQPVFAETALWITGSSNYLWGTLLILLFLLPYRLYKGNRLSVIKDIIFSTLMFIGGIIAGWTNENTAAAMLIMIICFILYYRSSKKKVPTWMYTGFTGAIIGYIIMIVAPGNFARAEGTSIDAFLIVYRTLNYTQRFVNYLGLLNLGVALLMIAYIKLNPNNKKTTLYYILVYLVGVFVSIYIMIASPGFPARAWFGTITFNIIVFVILYNKINNPLPIIKQMKYCFLVFCIISFSASYYDAYKDVTSINNIWKERMTIIEVRKKENSKSVVFKEYQAKTKFGLGDTPYALPYISLYYGIDFQLEK